MTDEPDFREILLADDLICASCRKSIHSVKKSYRVGNRWVHVLYLKDEKTEQLWSQYALCRDTALAELFLHGESKLIRRLKRCVLLPDSPSDERILALGFDPLRLILESQGLDRILRPAQGGKRRPRRKRCLRITDTAERVSESETGDTVPVLVLMAGSDWLKAHRKDRRLHPFFR